MKLLKRLNQRGDAHIILIFVVLFAVVGIVGVMVSRAQTGLAPVLGNGISGKVVVLDHKGQENPFANAKGNIYQAQDCPISSQTTVAGTTVSNSVCNAPSKATFETNSNGGFSSSLDPGEYLVSVDLSGFNDNNNRTCSSATAKVERMKYSEVKITCKESGISGVVKKFNEWCGESQQCEQPFANFTGKITKLDPRTGVATAEVSRFKTDASGLFVIKLAAGTYTINTDPNDGGREDLAPQCSQQNLLRVEVASGKYSEVKISCKIRATQTRVTGVVTVYVRGDVFNYYQFAKGTIYGKSPNVLNQKFPFAANGEGQFFVTLSTGKYEVVTEGSSDIVCDKQEIEVPYAKATAEFRISCGGR